VSGVREVTVAVTFPPPWFELTGAHRDGIQAEYDREITRAHLLHGRAGRVIGKSDAGDDVVVALSGGEFAIVHLTWVERERLPHLFPGFRLFADADALSAHLAEGGEADD
jgi:hypothetical protein